MSERMVDQEDVGLQALERTLRVLSDVLPLLRRIGERREQAGAPRSS